jgi:hypothetical protein
MELGTLGINVPKVFRSTPKALEEKIGGHTNELTKVHVLIDAHLAIKRKVEHECCQHSDHRNRKASL